MARSRRMPVRPEPRPAGSSVRAAVRPSEFPIRRDGAISRIVRRLLGLRRRVDVDGVRYREARVTPLERSIAEAGKPGKQYTVTFPTGQAMTITATAERRFADLMDVPELRSIRLGGDLFRPGARVLVLGAGTGALAEMVAGRVGPHGAVVAIEHDGESVRFARRRYAAASVSFERGGPEALAGEVDGSFDTVVLAEAWLARVSGPAESRGLACREAWRVTRPGGRLIAVGDGGAESARAYLGFDPGPVGESRRTPKDGGPVLLVIDRPEPKRRDGGNRRDGATGA